uniref:Nuclear pore glycoprotein p62 n=1 Tax=Oryzias latipes TaxID=8090 RepID=A0A3P9LIC5_ORYLA
MSGGFNFGQPSGFAFGAQKTTAAAPAPGFSLTNSTAAASGTGFSFGTPTQSQTNANPTGGFSFGAPAKNSSAGTGFSFGTPNAAAPTGTFGLATTPQTTVASGLTLGSSAAPAAGSGFTLGGMLSSQTNSAAPAGGGFNFGATSQAPPAATVAPTTTTTSGGMAFGGFSFGAPKVQVTSAASTTIAAGGGGFSFGTPAPSTLTQPAPAAAAPAQAAPTQGGGFNFGIKPSSTPAPPASTQSAPTLGLSLFASPIITTSAAAPTSGFTLGAAPALSTSMAASTAAGTAPSFMLKPLGSVASTAANTGSTTTTTTAAVTANATAGFTLGFKPPTISSSTTASTATAVTTTTTAPPVMTYAQLEGLINKWSLELQDQERHFLQQATQVNAWDRMLVENGEKITSLHKEMEKVKLDQRRLNQELDFILSQQKELEDLLCPLEETVKEQSGTIYMQNADEERERTYKLAENVDAQLKRMSQDLKEIIEHLNTSSGPADTSDPLQQICKILNAHMDSLQWIDQNSVLLHRRVEEVSKQCDTQRKEQEKTFRLTFD